MPLEVKWYDDEHTILLGTMAKNTTWEDYHAAIDKVVYEASQVTHSVALIIHDEVGMPVGNPLPHIKIGITKLSKQNNIEASYVAGSRGSSGFVRAILEAVGKMLGNQRMTNAKKFGGFVKTLDEAVAQIQTVRAASADRAVPSASL